MQDLHVQRTWLHTFDPKAMYHIAIKNADAWSKGGGKLKKVFFLISVGGNALTFPRT